MKNDPKLKNWKSRTGIFIRNGQLKRAEKFLNLAGADLTIACDEDNTDTFLGLKERLFKAYLEKKRYKDAIRIIEKTIDVEVGSVNYSVRSYKFSMIALLLVSKEGRTAWMKYRKPDTRAND